MGLRDAEDAIMQRIKDAGLPANVVWPDPSHSQNMPRIVMQRASGTQTRATLKGRMTGRPEVVARVETREGKNANPWTDEGVTRAGSRELVDAIIALFPANLRFSGVIIMDPPIASAPLPSDGAVYAVPVTITGWTTF